MECETLRTKKRACRLRADRDVERVGYLFAFPHVMGLTTLLGETFIS